MHRDAETGEQIIAGLTQVHVEVIVDRIRSRFGAEIELHPPQVPYIETIRSPAKAHGRYKKQTGGRGQFGDCKIELEPNEQGAGFEFVNAIKGGVIPGGFIPAVEKGIVEAFESLDAPVRIIGALDTPVPYSPPLEEYFLPSQAEIEHAARLLIAY